MARRSGRGFIKKDQVLEKLRNGREAAVQVAREAKIRSPEYEAALALNNAVNDLAEALTGNREYLWDRSHGIGTGHG